MEELERKYEISVFLEIRADIINMVATNNSMGLNLEEGKRDSLRNTQEMKNDEELGESPTFQFGQK